MLVWVLGWIGLAGFYLMAAGQISTTELIAGGGAVLLSFVFAVVLHRARTRDLGLHAPWLRLVGRALFALGRDTVDVGRVLLRTALRGAGGTAGLITLQPFKRGGGGSRDGGRRALVTLASSFAPNGYVLRILDRQDALALHRLAPAAPDADPDWPQ